MDLNTESWRELKQTDSGVKVLVSGDENNLHSVYFKNVNRWGGSPTIFNEYIAFRLGKILAFPLPKIQFLKFGDELGIISFNMPESNPWQAFASKDNATSLLEDPNVFSKVAVFDLWVKNIDRHDRNLIIQNVAINKYKIYMIDHEHCLYGADNNPPNKDDFGNIIKIENFKSYVPSIESLTNEVTKISAVSDDEIKGLIDEVKRNSDGQFQDDHAKIMKDLLLYRKGILQVKVEEWYNG